jgi:predicted dehydrogenase
MDLGQSPLEHLIDCLEQGRPTVATIRDAHASFIAAMAAYDAARQGRAVRIRN